MYLVNVHLVDWKQIEVLTQSNKTTLFFKARKKSVLYYTTLCDKQELDIFFSGKETLAFHILECLKDVLLDSNRE